MYAFMRTFHLGPEVYNNFTDDEIDTVLIIHKVGLDESKKQMDEEARKKSATVQRPMRRR